ncbi:hypothetical protein BDR22DRAFT_891320 [Usnea florida]
MTFILVEPIAGGAITGFLNATVESGLAYPTLIQNSTVEVPEIILYGTTDDKVPYLIQLSGIGKPTDQVARVDIEIGGKYSAFVNDFIIATIVPNANRTIVTVEGYEAEQ